jgi:CheY-like chemotaxis protein
VGNETEKRDSGAGDAALSEQASHPVSGMQPSAESVVRALGSVLEALPTPVLVARADRVLLLNRAFATLLAMSEPLRGGSLSGGLVSCAADERSKRDLLFWLVETKSLASTTSQPIRLMLRDRGPALVRLTAQCTPLGDDEVIVITAERVRPAAPSSSPPEDAVSAAERLASVGKLARGAAQAVNNPLLYVATNVTYSSERLVYISDLLDDSSPMQVKDPRTLRRLLLPVLEALSEAHVGATRASQLILDLRGLIDPDSVPTAVDLQAALDAAVNLAEGEVALRAHLRTNLEAEGHVLASTTRLTQLLLGLIVARAQGLEAGGPQKYRIEIRSWIEGDWALISLTDNTDSAHLAEGARRGDGLDLYGRLVDELAGTLEEQSSSEGGSTWILRLPLTSSSKKERSPGLSPVRPGQRTRVLIVDNEPLIVRALSRLLRADYDVETAGSGYEAFELIKHDGPFDLVLCDLGMPEMNGLELFEEAVRVAPEMGPRFVFVTGGAIDDQVRAKLSTLPNQVLEKPIQPALLREAVGQLLGAPQRRAVD